MRIWPCIDLRWPADRPLQRFILPRLVWYQFFGFKKNFFLFSWKNKHFIKFQTMCLFISASGSLKIKKKVISNFPQAGICSTFLNSLLFLIRKKIKNKCRRSSLPLRNAPRIHKNTSNLGNWAIPLLRKVVDLIWKHISPTAWDGLPMDKSEFYHSQASLVPILRPRGM